MAYIVNGYPTQFEVHDNILKNHLFYNIHTIQNIPTIEYQEYNKL
jgi:hypothetical protein